VLEEVDMRSIRACPGAALISLGLTCLFPTSASAARFFHGSRIVVSEPDTIHDDVYAAGGSVIIRGIVDGDVVVTGGQVEVKADVTGSVIAAGGDVRVLREVGGSVRAAGGRVTIGANIVRDLVAAGGRVAVEDARIGRDAVIAGGRGDLNGSIGRDVRAGVRELTLGERAVIAGNLEYAGERPITKEPGAVVNGRTSWFATRPAVARKFVAEVRWAIGLCILGLLLLVLFPAFTRRSFENLSHRPLEATVAGLVACVAIPLAALTLFVTGILIGGWWIGAALGMGWLLSLAIGIVMTSMALGRWLLGRLGPREPALGFALVTGVALFALVRWIPFAGRLVILLALLPGLGAVASTLPAAMKASRLAAGAPAA